MFSWRDSKGDIHPLVKKAAMERVNEVLEQHGWSATFGHPFHCWNIYHVTCSYQTTVHMVCAL